MIRVKIKANNETCIIDNGKTYLFNAGGKCIKEDAGDLSSNMSSALDLPCISILSSNGEVEIALSETGGSFRRFACSEDAMSCALKVQTSGKFLRMLRRDGKQDNLSFNQLIFVYQEGTSLLPIISSLKVQEVFE